MPETCDCKSNIEKKKSIIILPWVSTDADCFLFIYREQVRYGGLIVMGLMISDSALLIVGASAVAVMAVNYALVSFF